MKQTTDMKWAVNPFAIEWRRKIQYRSWTIDMNGQQRVLSEATEIDRDGLGVKFLLLLIVGVLLFLFAAHYDYQIVSGLI